MEDTGADWYPQVFVTSVRFFLRVNYTDCIKKNGTLILCSKHTQILVWTSITSHVSWYLELKSCIILFFKQNRINSSPFDKSIIKRIVYRFKFKKVFWIHTNILSTFKLI